MAASRSVKQCRASVYIEIPRTSLELPARSQLTRCRSRTIFGPQITAEQEGQIVALFAKTMETYARLDILVNNAGVPTHINIEDISLAYWREVLDINITAAFLCCREAIKIMKDQTPQGGRIINMGSVSAKTPRPDSLPYTTTKFAIQGMTHQLTMDGRKYGVVASIIHPGATLSSFSTRRGRTKAGPGATPDDYIMAAEDVAKVAVLMATLPPEVNLYEATILPNHMRSFIGRG
jgi:NAD(P)-dependent dehydrogenase (short-subunit alcohol dehydrogenase family)